MQQVASFDKQVPGDRLLTLEKIIRYEIGKSIGECYIRINPYKSLDISGYFSLDPMEIFLVRGFCYGTTSTRDISIRSGRNR